MGLILTILLGALVGYVAAHLMGRNEGFIASTVIGIVGAFVGNFISYLIGGGKQAFLALDLSGLLWSLGGALVVVLILNSFQNRGRRV
jgi:uncharacterized membrane protein YeaQ/YmgE (transglycosylase-associated protein family)